MTTSFLLSNFPDPAALSHDELLAWLGEKVRLMNSMVYSPDVLATFGSVELAELAPHALGAEASPEWRKFFLAALLADWACYETPVDRVDFARLKYIMTSAHPYFRVWCVKVSNEILPVGYSAWYPIAPFVFNALQKDPSQINDRGIFMPLRFVKSEEIKYAYAFNISIVKPLRNTVYSRRVIRAYQQDAKRFPSASIATITVTGDGTRMATIGGGAVCWHRHGSG